MWNLTTKQKLALKAVDDHINGYRPLTIQGQYFGAVKAHRFHLDDTDLTHQVRALMKQGYVRWRNKQLAFTEKGNEALG
jgi:hypothetical protein